MECLGMADDRPWIYRIEYISEETDEEALKLCFAPEDRENIKIESLAESVDDERKPRVVAGRGFSEEDIDDKLQGFTPLYTTEGGGDTDIIALTGLAGHPFHSWQNGPRMWLKDFLPSRAPQCRVLVFGYNSSIANAASNNRLFDFVTDFKEKLKTVRRCPPGRPLILIGHSLGGLVLKKAVHDINYTLESLDWLNVQSIIFIATPHRGLEVEALCNMVKGQPSDMLIAELQKDSSTLIELGECFKTVAKDIQILTLYERQLTNTVQQAPDGSWRRSGTPRFMVSESSAILHVQNEKTLPCQADHSAIAKLQRGQGGPFSAVCLHIFETLEAMRRKKATVTEASTALHTAAQQNNVRQAKSLLTSGCDLHARNPDRFGMTALDIARSLGHLDMVEFLSRAGASTFSRPVARHTSSKPKWGSKLKMKFLRPFHCHSCTRANTVSSMEQSATKDELSVPQSILSSTGLLKTWGHSSPAQHVETSLHTSREHDVGPPRVR